MLRFSLGGIPVLIHPLFWLTAFLFGGGLRMEGPGAWIPIFVWTVAMFVSVLAHEMGHALSARWFGGSPTVALHGLGGLTVLGLRGAGRWEQIFISAAGPAVGLLLAGVVLALYFVTRGVSPVLDAWINDMLWINIAWSLFNLLPILPMDGGQILRDLVGVRHQRICCAVGGILALLLTAACVWTGQYFMAVILVIMAVGNFKGTMPMEGGVQR